MITVIGLGCKNNGLSVSADKKIKSSHNVFVKTALTETYTYFEENKIENTPLDFIYEQAQSFDCLDTQIVDFLCTHNAEDICYCVNGSGYDDRSVEELAKRAEIEILPAAPQCLRNSAPSVASAQISAYELVSMRGFEYDTRLCLCVTDIDNAFVASDVKLVLCNILGDEQQVKFRDRTISLFELDRQNDYDYSACLFCPPLQLVDKKRFNIVDLYCVMRKLRGENGCPWDKAQTHQSIRQNAVEEAYELVEAINNDDLDNIIEESGDVLLQSMFHCIIGEDCGEYNWQDAVSALCRKLIDRHTHIFGDVKANNAEEALKAWDNAKSKEKKYNNFSEKQHGIASALPALMRANKIQSIAKKANFEFDSYDEVIDKIHEELAEFLSALDRGELEDEGGDLLFAVVNALRWQKIDPELALNHTNAKFVKRFEYVEAHCEGSMTDKSLAYLDNLWEEAKKCD